MFYPNLSKISPAFNPICSSKKKISKNKISNLVKLDSWHEYDKEVKKLRNENGG